MTFLCSESRNFSREHKGESKVKSYNNERKNRTFFTFARVSLILEICKIYTRLLTSLIERVIVFIGEKLCQLVTKFFVLLMEIKISL